MSPASKAQQKAVNKYMKNNYDRINLVMPKGRWRRSPASLRVSFLQRLAHGIIMVLEVRCG